MKMNSIIKKPNKLNIFKKIEWKITELIGIGIYFRFNNSGSYDGLKSKFEKLYISVKYCQSLKSKIIFVIKFSSKLK